MKKRVISAIVAIAIVIPIFLVGGIPFYVGVGLLAALAFKEIIDLKENKKIPMIIKLLAFACFEVIVYSRITPEYIHYMTGISYAIIGATVLLLIIPSIFDRKGIYTTKTALHLLGSVITIALFFNLLILLRNADKWILLYLILVAVMTDTFAMIIGCLIGKHKLIPAVSPKKSVEGSVAGSLVGTIVASIFYHTVVSSNINTILLVIMTLLLSILGQIGDLFFSKLKRENEIKDFSNIMPGHGGILDRLDSLSFIVIGYIIIYNIIMFI